VGPPLTGVHRCPRGGFAGGDLKNLVFHGDGLICPPEGYGEQIVELLTLRRPGAAFTSFLPGEENLTLDAALRGAAALIGKAPDFVLLGLGNADMLRGVAPAEALETLRALVQVLLLKTQARVSVATVCGAFLPPEARAGAAAFNAGLPSLSGDRVGLIDLDGPVNGFLDAHRRGGGEKRSLHAQPLRLTSMGRVFLSNTALGLISLEDLFPG
jgi:hypothetical protein